MDIATQEEMAQLHRFFVDQNAMTGEGRVEASDKDITFEKGTLCTD